MKAGKNVPDVNTHKTKSITFTLRYTKDFNQWLRRNLKYHVMFETKVPLVAIPCENNKHTLNEARKKELKKQPKRSRFLLCWYQITKQYRLIIIYSLARCEWRFVMKEAFMCFLFLSFARWEITVRINVALNGI